ncbi:MAG: F0F1 ATP synthase subunit B [Bacteroidaceae bacterium]|nr:F0F1 ATP synthase subunit B [Bacteroidaceae bacterium]
MELFTPDAGLLFWMVLSFGVVFLVLAKWGFPVITRMVDDRKRFIDQSLDAAREANEKLTDIKKQSETILAQAREEQAKILKEAADTRALLIEEARAEARTEGARLLSEARVQIQQEKEAALRDIRQQTAQIAIEVAEKIMRKSLTDERQHMELIERMVESEGPHPLPTSEE